MDARLETVLPDHAIDYLSYVSKKGRQASTIKRYHYDLEDFFRWLKSHSHVENWSHLTDHDIETYFSFLKQKRHYKVRTLKRIVTVLNQFYRYQQHEGNVQTNPLNDIDMPKLASVKLKSEDFLTKQEQERLLNTLESEQGLTDHQRKARPLLIDRNVSIVSLFLSYGLSLQELAKLKMQDIYFNSSRLHISSTTSKARTITLHAHHKDLIYSYYQTIPAPVRPRYRSYDPLFVAFDFQRQTYRWSYELDQPKALTEIAIQKMIREEVKRAGLRKGISAQHMRHSYILAGIKNDVPLESIEYTLGLKTPGTLKRYVEFIREEGEE